MMRFYACDSCLTIVRVRGDAASMPLIETHSLWRGGHPCVRTECGSKMYRLKTDEFNLVMDASKYGVFRVVDLTVQECFAAMCGYGLPSEIGSEPENIKALLLSSAVIDVSTCTSPSGRTVLDRLDLANDTSLHLAASSHGPVVFKVTRRSDVRAGNDSGALQQGPADNVVRGACRCDQGVCGGGCGDGEHTSELHEPRDTDGEHDREDTQISPEVPNGCSDHDTWDDEADTVRTDQFQRIRVGREDEELDQG